MRDDVLRGHEVGILLLHIEQIRLMRPQGTVTDTVANDNSAKIIRNGVNDGRANTA